MTDTLDEDNNESSPLRHRGQAHNAIGINTCSTCRFFHRPQGGPNGACIAHPPTPFVVGAVVPKIVDPKQPPVPQHIIRAYFPVVCEADGCGEHQSAVARRFQS